MKLWVIIRKGPVHPNDQWYMQQVLDHHFINDGEGLVFYEQKVNLNSQQVLAAYLAKAASILDISFNTDNVQIKTYCDGDGFDGVLLIASHAKKKKYSVKKKEKKPSADEILKEESDLKKAFEVLELISFESSKKSSKWLLGGFLASIFLAIIIFATDWFAPVRNVHYIVNDLWFIVSFVFLLVPIVCSIAIAILLQPYNKKQVSLKYTDLIKDIKDVKILKRIIENPILNLKLNQATDGDEVMLIWGRDAFEEFYQYSEFIDLGDFHTWLSKGTRDKRIKAQYEIIEKIKSQVTENEIPLFSLKSKVIKYCKKRGYTQEEGQEYFDKIHKRHNEFIQWKIEMESYGK